MIKQCMHMPAGNHSTPLSKLKVTSLCYVTVRLKCQEKIVNIFFLIRIYFPTRKCMFDTFTKISTRNYKAAHTIIEILPNW